MEENPIVVPGSAVPDQLASAIRALLVALGGYAVGRGWMDDGLVQAAIPVVLLAWPVIWSQLKARSAHAKLVATASAAPDHVARVV